MTDVRLLYVDGCPNVEETVNLLRQALVLAQVDADVTLVQVSSAQEADRLGFRGSPTVLLDGWDPFADAAAPTGLSCRLFDTPAGRRGVPTSAQLLTALTGLR